MGQVTALASVVNQTWAFFMRLTVAISQLYGYTNLLRGRRSVLGILYNRGFHTVPQLARSLNASRQHVQTIVNELAAEGLVRLILNPHHKRSRLVRLTKKGKDITDDMYRREAEILLGLNVEVSEREMLDAVGVLRSLSESFQREEQRKVQWSTISDNK
jgi:DNA-binding MarR family transcriptional regulator